MKNLVYILLSVLIISVIGCKKDPYPYISLSDVKKIDSLVHPAIKNAAFIYQNNIYYIADFIKPVTQITTNGSAARFVKISHDHSKFAYLNSSGIIVIVDDKGNVITTLSQYTLVKCFDWSADDKTLYILNNNSMVYYGPSLNLPSMDYSGPDAKSDVEVLSASVSMKGDFAYVVEGFDFMNGYSEELVIAPAGNGQRIEYSDPDDAGYTMDYVNFSSNLQDLVLGYTESGNYFGNQENIKCFTGLKAYPDGGAAVGSNSATPVYNSTLNYIVTGLKSSSNTYTGIAPAAVYQEAPSMYAGANTAKTLILSNYSVAGGSFYIDWK
jgi:hypothetical protein